MGKSDVKSVYKHLSDKVKNDDYVGARFIGKKLGKVLLAIVILVTTHIVGSLFSSQVVQWGLKDQQNNFDSEQLSEDDSNMLRSKRNAISIVARILYYVILIVGIVIVLYLFGLEVGNIVALIGAAGFILGFSLQGTLSDVASGIMLSFFQTYRTGDFVKTPEVQGRVTDFRLINTVIQDFENALVSVPNSKMQGSVVLNLSSKVFYIHEIILNLSNDNSSFDDIYRILKADLKDEEKYPEILRKGKNVPKIVIDVVGMVGWTTQVRVRVPIRTRQSMLLDVASVFAKLRQTLQDNDVKTLVRRVGDNDAAIDAEVV